LISIKIIVSIQNKVKNHQIIVIGGSAGSFQVITQLLSTLPEKINVTIILCLHRLRYVRTGFVEALRLKTKCPIVEPFDKEKIRKGFIYLAPSNYHILIEQDFTISLSTEEPNNHSRPSIDLLFESAAYNLKGNLTGIILSGANVDGAYGLKCIKEHGGIAIVQNPKEAQINTMPSEAIKLSKTENIFLLNQIIDYIQQKL